MVILTASPARSASGAERWSHRDRIDVPTRWVWGPRRAGPRRRRRAPGRHRSRRRPGPLGGPSRGRAVRYPSVVRRPDRRVPRTRRRRRAPAGRARPGCSPLLALTGGRRAPAGLDAGTGDRRGRSRSPGSRSVAGGAIRRAASPSGCVSGPSDRRVRCCAPWIRVGSVLWERPAGGGAARDHRRPRPWSRRLRVGPSCAPTTHAAVRSQGVSRCPRRSGDRRAGAGGPVRGGRVSSARSARRSSTDGGLGRRLDAVDVAVLRTRWWTLGDRRPPRDVERRRAERRDGRVVEVIQRGVRRVGPRARAGASYPAGAGPTRAGSIRAPCGDLLRGPSPVTRSVTGLR